jgi:hypothetical protein
MEVILLYLHYKLKLLQHRMIFLFKLTVRKNNNYIFKIRINRLFLNDFTYIYSASD